MDKKDLMRQLIDRLNQSAHSYYDLNISEISDDEWDGMYTQLKALENELGFIYPDSPTHRVGGQVMDGFEQHRHITRLLSMDKAQSFDEIISWFNRAEKNVISSYNETIDSLFVEYKLDGLTINLTYDNGVLINAATRGDGIIGEEILAQVKTIKTIPLEIPFRGKMEVQGEGLMRLSHLKKYNESASEPLKNARNAAAGALRNLDPIVTASRNLDAFFYQVGYIETIQFKNQIEMLTFLRDNGFQISPYVREAKDLPTVFNYITEIESQRNNLDYLIDGVTIKISSFKYRELLGNTDKFPRWAIAYKYPAQELITRLTNITWEVGRTGKLTPLAHVEPVDIYGVTVKRATLNNYGDICRKQIRIGSRVWIRRSNDVIPEILGVVDNKENETLAFVEKPEKCPFCKQKLFENGANLFCMNRNTCKPQIVARLTHFASRQGMDIESFSKKTASLFYDHLQLRTADQLYSIEKNQLTSIPGIGDKKALKILEEINNSKNCELNKFLYAIGIPNIGKKTALDLMEHFPDLESLMNAPVDKLKEMKDIGFIVSSSIVDFFQHEDNRLLVKNLLDAGVSPYVPKEKNSLSLNGLSFVLTGTLPTLGRTKAEELIKKNGGKTTSSITKNTNYLLAGEKPGSKMAHAIKLNIPIINEEQFLKMIIK